MSTTEPIVGSRLRLITSSRLDIPIKPGDTGVIWRVTQFGTVRVKWDSGINIDLDPETDHWEVLTDTVEIQR